MKSTGRNWVLSFAWANLSVAVVVLILLLAHELSGPRELLRTLAYALVYANSVTLLGLWLGGSLLQKLTQRKLPLLVAVAFCILVVVPLGCLLVQIVLLAIGVVDPRYFWREYGYVLRVSFPLGVVFGLGAFVHASLRDRLQLTEHALREKDVAEQRAQKLATEARLRSLESRIHPHFLFNTLNSIAALIATDPSRAEQMVGALSVLLRTSLDNGERPLIALREELAMVQSYLEIERARFGDKLRGRIEAPVSLQGAQVPPMSVQTLVENAVKHGITPQAHGGEVRVSAMEQGANLRIEVCDSGDGFDLAMVPAGHGLDNLVERLNSFFGDKARLNAFRRDEGSIVEMILPRV